MVRTRAPWLWLLALACHSAPDSSFKAAPLLGKSTPASASRAPSPLPLEPPPPWADALRAQRYRDAERAFEALPADAQRNAELRFAWARTRLELGQAAAGLPLLAGLEQSLPTIAPQVQALRTQLLLAAGPAAEAAQLLEARGDPLSLASAAQAWLEAGDAERAFKVAERGLVNLGKGRGAHEREVALRFARGLAAAKLERPVWPGDLRFVALEAPLSDEAKTAVAKLATLGEKSPLSPSDRLARARALAAAGRSADLESELSFIEPVVSRLARAGVPASLRATALFNARGDYRLAEKLFAKASELGTEDAAKELFYMARSRARAQDDAGAEAGYRLLLQRFGTTPWAEQAELSIARIHLAAGAFEKAASAYGQYLAKRGARARFFDDASYEQAVSLLCAGQALAAVPLLQRLVARAKDPRFESQLRELTAVALLNAGKREEAVHAFERVIAEFPLSFPALAAAARLRALGSNLPAWLEPPPSGGAAPSPLDLRLPADVALLHRIGLDGDAAGALLAQEHRIARSHAPRSGEALCELYGLLDVADRRYAIGQDAATRAGLDRAPGPRSRWMWDCVFPRPYSELVTRFERERLLPRGLIWAVMRQESGFRAAVRSPVGAVGLLQLMPSTAERIAEELGEKLETTTLTQAHASVRLGSAYLRKLIDAFQGSVPLALAAYNAGPQAVARWLVGGEKLPLDLFVARIPYEETRGYVARVLSNQARYAYLEGGEGAVQAPPLELPQGVQLPDNSY